MKHYYIAMILIAVASFISGFVEGDDDLSKGEKFFGQAVISGIAFILYGAISYFLIE